MEREAETNKKDTPLWNALTADPAQKGAGDMSSFSIF